MLRTLAVVILLALLAGLVGGATVAPPPPSDPVSPDRACGCTSQCNCGCPQGRDCCCSEPFVAERRNLPQLPSRKVCEDVLAVARDELAQINAAAAAINSWQLRERQKDAWRAVKAWRLAVLVQGDDDAFDYFDEDDEMMDRDEAPDALRNIIGDDAFFKGRLPWPTSLR